MLEGSTKTPSRLRASCSSRWPCPAAARWRLDKRGAHVGYGLGNFAFYATSDPGTEIGVLWLKLVGRSVVDAEWIPARIVDGIPLRRTGAAGQQILDSLNDARSCTGLLDHPPG